MGGGMSALALLALLITQAVDAGAIAQPFSVRARPVPNKVELGEPFDYEIVINHPSSQRYDLHAPGTLDDFELIDHSRSRQDGADTATTTFKLKLSAFALGEKTLPTLSFDVQDGEHAGAMPVEGPDVEIVGTLSVTAQQNGAEFRDLKPLEEVPVRSYGLLYGLSAAVAAILLAYQLWKFSKRSRAKPSLPPAPVHPLHVRTREALDALRNQNLPGQGKVREFYFRLSEILRGYLADRFAFEALECTSSELLEMLPKLRTPGLELEQITAFIHEADLAKFARAPLGVDECKQAMDFAYRLVTDTTNASQPRVP
ncbi:MAG: BatD family protein [Myxococcaceae bacterium]